MPYDGTELRFIDGLPSMLWTFLAAFLFAYMLAIALTALVGSDLVTWRGFKKPTVDGHLLISGVMGPLQMAV